MKLELLLRSGFKSNFKVGFLSKFESGLSLNVIYRD